MDRLLEVEDLELGRILEEVHTKGAVSVKILSDAGRVALLAEARSCAPLGQSPGPYSTILDFLSSDNVLRNLNGQFQLFFDQQMNRLPEYSFSPRLFFNELDVTRYSFGFKPLAVHNDGNCYRNLICLFMLEGRARFFICDDNEKSNSREVSTELGNVIIMRENGFRGFKGHQLHYVTDIEHPRYVLGLRQKIFLI